MWMNNMGTEQRAKMLARQQNHDISEKFVLGFTELTLSKESMLDLRLFNQELLSGSFEGEESFEKPLFHGRPHGPRSPGLVMHCPHTSSHLSEVSLAGYLYLP
jgi:hypothetical protein